jgi:hypothetical protein
MFTETEQGGVLMRITIENTFYTDGTKIIIERPADDLTLDDMFEMFAGALEGFGFVGAKKYLEGEE